MSYASYCQDQGIDCARRARMASSPEVVTYWRHLGLRGLRLEDQAEGTRAWDNRSDKVEGVSFRCLYLDLERETTHAKANAMRYTYSGRKPPPLAEQFVKGVGPLRGAVSTVMQLQHHLDF